MTKTVPRRWRAVKAWAAWCVLAVSMLLTGRADALPDFSRKTGMSCTSCHDAWPRLNDFGDLYRDRGYRVGNTDDNLWGHPLDYFPVSARILAGYQYSATTSQATDQGIVTVHSGAFQFPAADLYVAGALANHVSVYVDIAGFGADGAVSLESAWVRGNDLLTNWLNVKLGKQELYLPYSMHRAHTIIAPFLIYNFHPVGSTNPFNLNENQLAVEVSGHEGRPGVRYSVALATSNDLASSWTFSAPTIYGHVTDTFLTRSELLPRVLLGLVGDVGWAPTQFLTLTPTGGAPVPVSGTGSANATHSHAGGNVQFTFLSISLPLTLTGVWLYGQEAAALVPGGTQDAQFQGGFVSLDYVPILPLIVGVRYDGVYNIQQANPTQPTNANQQESYSLYARYAVWMSSWGSAMLHLEASTLNTQNAGATPGTPVRSSFVFGGVDFAL